MQPRRNIFGELVIAVPSSMARFLRRAGALKRKENQEPSA
jgi:hypothetical protein